MGGDKLDMTLGQLSGGWKMKMGLVRAMLMEADILMMDEPTGHLDKFNTSWLIDYIKSLECREIDLLIAPRFAYCSKVRKHLAPRWHLRVPTKWLCHVLCSFFR